MESCQTPPSIVKAVKHKHDMNKGLIKKVISLFQCEILFSKEYYLSKKRYAFVELLQNKSCFGTTYTASIICKSQSWTNILLCQNFINDDSYVTCNDAISYH